MLNNLQRKTVKIKSKKTKDRNGWLVFISGHIRKGEFWDKKKVDLKRFDKIAMLDRLLFVQNNNC